MLKRRLPAALHAAAAVALGVVTAMHILAGSPPVSIVLFAVSAFMNVGLACWHITIMRANNTTPAPIKSAPSLPSLAGDDLAARVRRDIRRAATLPGPGHRATGLRPLTSPEWIVIPYADPHACWGCGLEPEGPHRALGGCRLCWWCTELLDVDKANQRREQERPWPGLML